MACPFFMPVERLEEGTWPHPRRLPLGCGWSGHCTAPGHEGEIPSRKAQVEFCNLGYAQSCVRLPQDRAWDAVRFAICAEKHADVPVISSETVMQIIPVMFVCEFQHRPKDYGKLEFDGHSMRWVRKHPDSRVQRMAECFLETYLVKRKSQTNAEPWDNKPSS
jgi:hypothetical protein